MKMALKELTEVIGKGSQVVLQINTKFKPEYQKCEEAVHRKLRNYFYFHIEKIMEQEDLADRIVRSLKRHFDIPQEIKEFQDLGTISLSVVVENEA